MTSWDDVRTDLNTHQRLRFASRTDTDYRALRVNIRPRPESSVEPLWRRLLQLFADSEQPRLVALVGGPASGKSYTAWKIFAALASAAALHEPFYLPLAYVPFEERRFTDLYQVAYFIHNELVNYQTPFDSSRSYPGPSAAQLFILDDASFADQAVTRSVVRRHLNKYPDDRILILLQEEPMAQSFGVRPSELVTVQLKGLKHYRTADIERLRCIDTSEASWPMIDDVLGKCRFDHEPTSSIEFYQKLQVYAFKHNRADDAHENFMALAASVLGDPLFLLWHPLQFSPDWARRGGIAIDGRGGEDGHPHQFLFTYSDKMGLAFANTAAAGYVFAMWKLAHSLAEGSEGTLLTSGIINPEDRRLLSNITFTAYIDALSHRLSYDQDLRFRRSLEIISNIADRLPHTDNYRPLLVQLGKLLRQVDHSWVNYYHIGGISGNEGNVAVGSAIAQGYGSGPDTVATLLARLDSLLQSDLSRISAVEKVEIKERAAKLLAAL